VATACGWALYRVGLDEADATLVRRIRTRAPRLPAVGRAWAVRSLAAVEAPPAWAARDPELVVRVAAVSGPHVAIDAVLAALDDPSPWVADQALLTAAARPLAQVQARLRSLYDAHDAVWARAALAGALSAAGAVPLPEDLVGDPRVAGAWMGTAPPAAFVTLGDGPAPRVVGVAGAVLSRLDELVAHPDAEPITQRLMHGPEPVGWAAAAALAAKRGDFDTVARLLGRADGDTVQTALQAIVEVEVPEPQRARLAAAIAPYLGHSQSRLRVDARAALDHLGVEPAAAPAPTWGATPAFGPPDAARSVVVTTSRGALIITLHPDIAPRAVQAFVHLCRQGFYDDVVWHRVVPAFVVQTGDPTGTGWGGPGFALPDEDSQADYVVGAVGFAKSGPDTAGSQWFITTVDQPHLTGDYTLFGTVTSGMDVALALRQGDRIDKVQVVDR
jgi:cyclophilin family peptidyl-prolyl cis-trans isomerase